MTLREASAAWRVVLGATGFTDDPAALLAAQTATFATDQQIPAILFPENRKQVAACLEIAHRFSIPVYPISRGKNWGYGSRVPASSGCVVLSLERMNRILDFDNDLATLTVEPGVSFAQVQDFLKKQGAALTLPSPGSTLEASVVGHVLERGLAVGLEGERAHYISGLEVLLADGRCIHTGFGQVKGSRVSTVAPDGVGPDLTGLFLQSNFGVVVSLTIWLTPRPNFSRRVVWSIQDAAKFPALIDQVRGLLRERLLAATVGLYNDYKRLTYLYRHPDAQSLLTRPNFPKEMVASLQGGVWFGETDLTASSERIGWAMWDEIERRLKAVAEVHILPQGYGVEDSASIDSIYWRKSGTSSSDPDADQCGVIWICPVVPLRAADVSRAVDCIEHTMLVSGFEPIIGMQILTFRKAVVVASILYDRVRTGEDEKAMACYVSIQQQLMRLGYPPYRMGLQNLMLRLPLETDTMSLIGQIKTLVDPDHIIAPGRYQIPDKKVSPKA